MMAMSTWRWPIVALASGALANCSAADDRATAERGVAEFRTMMDAGRFREIYSGASPDFRQTGTEQHAVAFLDMVHKRLGPVRRTTQQGWHVNVRPGVTT